VSAGRCHFAGAQQLACKRLASRLQGPTALFGGGCQPRRGLVGNFALRRLGALLRRRRPPHGSSRSHAGRCRPGTTARELVQAAGSADRRRRPGVTPAGASLRRRWGPALGYAGAWDRRLATPEICLDPALYCAVSGFPTGSAAAMPAAAGPGLRRGCQSRPRAARHAAAGPGSLPPAPCRLAGGGRPLATPELCQEPGRVAGSSASCRQPGGPGLRRGSQSRPLVLSGPFPTLVLCFSRPWS